VTDLEVLIVGDGASPATAAAAAALEREDGRVRFFALPKGPRHGEVHRHAVLSRKASGEAVLYLSDDDLWLPDHAERLRALL
jgi:GalNAc5-diNAcBac-PP-undecaprenol beta-1,3-glucosyltransferase